MEIEIFTLCDAATNTMGKLNILGTFDQINAPQFPTVYPLCAVGLRVRFERIEEGNHPMKIQFVNADGQPIRPPVTGGFDVQFGRADTQWLCANMALPIYQLKLDAPGHYSIDLAIDGRQERSLPLRVVLTKPPGPAPEPAK